MGYSCAGVCSGDGIAEQRPAPTDFSCCSTVKVKIQIPATRRIGSERSANTAKCRTIRRRAAWEKLGNAYPTDVAVQTSILTTGESAWSNRMFIKKTIDRLKAVTGDQATAWKIAYSRWLLSGNGADKDASQAVVLLSGITTSNPEEYLPHVLLATAYDRLKNYSSGLDEWHKAADLSPQSALAQFNLLKALDRAGKKEESQVLFDQLARISNLSPDMALAAATILASEGDMQRAESMLVAIPNPPTRSCTMRRLRRFTGWKTGRTTQPRSISIRSRPSA